MAQSADAALAALELPLDRESDVGLGTQLAWKLRAAVAGGRLGPGERLPGVRELATAAAVNVNTVRAVYGKLAEQGVLVSEHGRGTFVAREAVAGEELGRLVEMVSAEARSAGVDPRELAAALYASRHEPGSEAAEARHRRELREEIADLERRLAGLDPALTRPSDPSARPRGPRPSLLTAAELAAVRDDLAERWREAVVARRDAEESTREEEPAAAIGRHSPQLVLGAGTWTLRWKA